jgi:hypothetical protein
MSEEDKVFKDLEEELNHHVAEIEASLRGAQFFKRLDAGEISEQRIERLILASLVTPAIDIIENEKNRLPLVLFPHVLCNAGKFCLFTAAALQRILDERAEAVQTNGRAHKKRGNEE